jgi:hypothetical protein
MNACRKAGVALPTSEDLSAAGGNNAKRVREFRVWWLSPGEYRTDFLVREIRYAVEHEAELRQAAEADGVVAHAADLAVLQLKEGQVTSEAGRQKLARANRLRSWYKGGRVFEEIGGDMEARRRERLAWRTEFLARRTAKVEEAHVMAADITEALIQYKVCGDCCRYLKLLLS